MNRKTEKLLKRLRSNMVSLNYRFKTNNPFTDEVEYNEDNIYYLISKNKTSNALHFKIYSYPLECEPTHLSVYPFTVNSQDLDEKYLNAVWSLWRLSDVIKFTGAISLLNQLTAGRDPAND